MYQNTKVTRSLHDLQQASHDLQQASHDLQKFNPQT